MLIVQGSKDVVEFLVMNSTVVDVGGKRDTKKVMMMIIVMTIMMIIMKIKMTLDRQWFWYILIRWLYILCDNPDLTSRVVSSQLRCLVSLPTPPSSYTSTTSMTGWRWYNWCLGHLFIFSLILTPRYYQVHGIFDSSIGARLHDACLHRWLAQGVLH